MSFIYAINSAELSIMSDTKISLNDQLEKLWNTEDERRIIKQIGLIKSVIVSPNIVVSYAGNKIDKAAELLREIKSVGNSLEQIIEIAYKIHNDAEKDDIEFIIGYCDKTNRELISIKNGKVVRNCKTAWLGSWDAYNEFKRMENELYKIKRKKNIDIESTGNVHERFLDEEVDRIKGLEKIFREVIESGIDSTVGGMVVSIKIPNGENTFQYMAEIKLRASSWPQILELGESAQFYQGAEQGSYCCNIYQSKINFCCYIYEDKLGIVYTDELNYNQSLKGIKFPKLYKLDKEEFDLIAESNGAYSCFDVQ